MCSQDPGPVPLPHDRGIRIPQKHWAHDLQHAAEEWSKKLPDTLDGGKLMYVECLLNIPII